MMMQASLITCDTSPYQGFQIYFQQVFKEKYLRNTKTAGVKNMRCFPCCSTPVHTKQGFCGQAVTVEIVFFRLVDTNILLLLYFLFIDCS